MSSAGSTKRRTKTVTSVKRKTLSESPARSSAKKPRRTPSKPRAAASTKKTPGKRKTRARSASASRASKKSKKGGEEDEDPEMEDEDGQGIEGAVKDVQSRVRGAAQAVSDELHHLLPSVKETVAGARRSFDSVKDRALHAYEDLRDSVVGSTAHGKSKNDEEEDEEDEDEKGSRSRKRKGTPASQRHSSRPSTKQSSAATEGLTRSRKSDDGVIHRGGVELRTHKADISHLTQYHAEGTVIDSWRDAAQVAPHMVVHVLAILFLHWFLASIADEHFKHMSYEWFMPRRLRSIILPHWWYHLVLDTLKRFSLHYPVVLAVFTVTLYFFRASVRSVLLRHANTTLQDLDYHSGAFTGYFSRFAFGLVHMAFIPLYWHLRAHSENVLDLNILFWINLGYWAQDALANAYYRPQSQTSNQWAATITLLVASLFFALVDTPPPSWLGAWTNLVKPLVLGVVIILVFAVSVVSGSQFIHAHANFSRGLKVASWALLFAVYVPLSAAFVLVPTLASLADLIFHVIAPLKAHLPWHHAHTKTPHAAGNPSGAK